MVYGCRHKSTDVFLDSHIGGYSQSFTPFGTNLFCRFLKLGRGSGRQGDICAGFSQGNCNGSADASSGPGNDGHFAFQINLYCHQFQTLWLLTLI
jgi:hypothetical protein